jgi:flagellar biosynthesis/type III secretory pathway protein FliH
MEAIIRAAAIAKATRQLRRPMALPSKSGVDTSAALATEVRSASVPAGPVAVEDDSTQDYARELKRLADEFQQQQSAQELAVRQQREVDLAQAKSAAERLGYAAGLAQGESAAQQQVAEQAARLVSALNELHAARVAVIDGAEDIMVDIVYSALCRIVGEGAGQRPVVIGMVNQVLHHFREHEPLVVRLHPQDLALVQQALPELNLDPAQTQLRADATLKMGGCLVDSSVGTLDARLDTQLSRLRDTLLQARSGDEYAGEGL